MGETVASKFPLASMGTQRTSPSCSSSSSHPSSISYLPTLRWRHDVFLNFYGKDTRKSFTDHLYADLKQKGIDVFRDDEKLKRGTYIGRELMKAIRESKYAIIILSKNYAFSNWCLDELANIVKCMKETALTVLPVFYHVNPSDVEHQTGVFAKAFAKYEEDPEVSIKKIKKWKSALREVGKISGWHLHDR